MKDRLGTWIGKSDVEHIRFDIDIIEDYMGNDVDHLGDECHP